jgi:hypothetical protein
MAECSGNLLSNNLLASPVAETALKTTLIKLAMIVVSTCLDEYPKPQAILIFVCPLLSTYFQITSVSCELPAYCSLVIRQPVFGVLWDLCYVCVPAAVNILPNHLGELRGACLLYACSIAGGVWCVT